MVRKIIWSSKAQYERKEILAYWNKRNKSKAYSKKLNNHFKEATVVIAQAPNVGRTTTLENVRIKIVGDYLLVYKINPTTITILSIYDGRRNPEQFNKIL